MNMGSPLKVPGRRFLADRGDPSRTAGIVRSYVGELRRRWKRIDTLIWETVAQNDALQLRAAATAAGPYAFPTDIEGRTRSFLNWLNGAIDDEVLEVARGPEGRIMRSSRWQDVYVRSAYSRGLNHAERNLWRLGVPVPDEVLRNTFNAPIHADTLALLYGRQFDELEGISRRMSNEIARTMADGFARGVGPREMARDMRKTVGSLGLQRSVMMARTETIRAHAESTLNRYKEAGVDGVKAFAEFATAGDDRVCERCQNLETGEAIDLDKARGVIPVHPNCRCVWLPVLDKGKEKKPAPVRPRPAPRRRRERVPTAPAFDATRANSQQLMTELGRRAEGAVAEVTDVQRRLTQLQAQARTAIQAVQAAAVGSAARQTAMDEVGALYGQLVGAKKALKAAREKVREAWMTIVDEMVPEKAAITWTRLPNAPIRQTVTDGMAALNRMMPAVYAQRANAPATWSKLAVKTERGDRAWHTGRQASGRIGISRSSDIGTVVHEVAHHIEATYPEVYWAAKAWRDARTAQSGTSMVSLRSLFPGYGYKAGEITNPDHFFSPYIGRSYAHQSTEVVSMGFEAMWRDPVGFFNDDQDHFEFILRIMRGEIGP